MKPENSVLSLPNSLQLGPRSDNNSSSLSQSRFLREKSESNPNDQAKIWENEYLNLRTIPSSFRRRPSQSVLLFRDLLNYSSKQKVLDAGCGMGRNSVYFAQLGCEVFSVDFSSTALRSLETQVNRRQLNQKVHLFNQSLNSPLPFQDGYFDLILDSYVSCHFVNRETREDYNHEIKRVLSKKGFLIVIQPSMKDSYYRRFLTGNREYEEIVTDPINNVAKVIYSEAGIKKFFGKEFNLVYFTKLEFSENILGENYKRNIFSLVLQK